MEDFMHSYTYLLVPEPYMRYSDLSMRFHWGGPGFM